MHRIAATSCLTLCLALGSAAAALATPGVCAFPFLDMNANGKYDEASEPRLVDWEICLEGPDMDSCKLSNEQGAVCWLVIPTGSYQACLTLQEGFENTTPLCEQFELGDRDVPQIFFGVRVIPASPDDLFPSDAPDDSSPDGQLVGIRLGQSFPNPFRTDTWLPYTVLQRGSDPLRVIIFDGNGRVVRRLESTVSTPGTYSLHWDGTDDKGIDAPAGVYFYHTASGDLAPRRLIRVR